MSNQELMVSDQTYMPAMSIPQAAARFNTLVEFVQQVMKADVDYGIIPGTSKPTLLKPGAEKLTTLFGLTTRFVVVNKTEDWTGDQHGGELFFYYWYRCQLWRGERLIAEADGSCNSRESKYRWREAKRVCPACNLATIIKGKAEYGGGWLCFKKQGGCGVKYSDGDQAIEGQPAGRIPNPDICDQVNTFQKMSQKRAMIAAVLIGVNASEFFTQDVEDMQMIGNGASYTPPVQTLNTTTGEIIDAPVPEPKPTNGNGKPKNADEAQQRFYARYADVIGGQEWAAVQRYLVTRAPRPKTVEGWIATADAVRDKAQRIEAAAVEWDAIEASEASQ